MKKLVITFIVIIVILLTLVTGESFYVAKCRNSISKFQNEISNLQVMNKNLRSENLEISSYKSDLEILISIIIKII